MIPKSLSNGEVKVSQMDQATVTIEATRGMGIKVAVSPITELSRTPCFYEGD